MPRISKTNKIAQTHAVLAGMQKRIDPNAVFKCDGKKYRGRDLSAALEAYLAAIATAAAARAAYKGALAKEREAGKRAARVLRWVHVIVESHFGALVLEEFGWSVPKTPGPKTVAAKLRGVRKRQAGRAEK
jgi:hypothetical protein